ncbi:MAG: DUF58 domain-containing protein [Armatimonadota bacterium]|nr:DUF58 domain-containing protein [Armatimonadota bacterium]MDR7544634.1 DUF58 domain-containing protein [Armatimonadota bacterium]
MTVATRPLLFEPEFLSKLEQLSLLSHRLYRSGFRGERRSNTLGRGVEFADHRSYHIGDDYRYIDWHIYSRLDRLFVKLFSEEEDVTVHLFVDASRSMGWGEPSKLDYAVRVAAALGYIGLANLDRVGAVIASDRVRRMLAPLRGRPGVFRLFHFLSEAVPEGGSDLVAALREYSLRTHRRGVLVMISDLMLPEGISAGLRFARARRFEPFVIHLLSDEELAPPLAGDLRLVDSETGAAVEVTADAATASGYARARDRYFAEVEQACLRYEVEYLRAATSIPFEDLILRYLRAGGLIA